MDPINPWIDLGETRRLAERLMASPRESNPLPAIVDVDDGMDGFAMADVDGGFADEVEEVVPGEESREDVSEESVPLARGADFTAARVGICDEFGALGMMMVDAAGEVLFCEGGYDAFAFFLRDLAVRGSRGVSSSRLKLGSGSTLVAIPIESETGLQWLGVVLPAGCAADQVERIHAQWIASSGS